MTKLTHAYFGELTLPSTGDKPDVDVIWERSQQLAGETVDVDVWAASDKPLDSDGLDIFADRLRNLAALDASAREQLCRYLEDDRSYIEFHIEELPEQLSDSDLLPINALAPDHDASKVDVNTFVRAMRLKRVGLYASWLDFDDINDIVMDYMIFPELTDEILAVKFSRQGEFQLISWES